MGVNGRAAKDSDRFHGAAGRRRWTQKKTRSEDSDGGQEALALAAGLRPQQT
jgi:hypothetical protein